HLGVAGFTIVSLLLTLAAVCQWRLLWLARRPQTVGTERATTYHLLISLLAVILFMFAIHSMLSLHFDAEERRRQREQRKVSGRFPALKEKPGDQPGFQSSRYPTQTEPRLSITVQVQRQNLTRSTRPPSL